jgi:ABC-type lipoprotein release transport system permease subunit
MDQRLANSAAITHFYARVLTILGCCGLVLTIAGIYGVVAYCVKRRHAEIGIRLALGSSRAGVLLLMLRQGMRPVLVGIGIGLLTTLSTTRLLAAQLYGVGTMDPLTLASVTIALIGVSAFACYLPAREAAKVDPMVALRNE